MIPLVWTVIACEELILYLVPMSRTTSDQLLCHETRNFDASTGSRFIIGSSIFECLNNRKTLINSINSIVLLKHWIEPQTV